MQTIVMPEQRSQSYRKSIDFIQEHVFPGGFLPSLTAIQESVGRVTDLRLLSVNDHSASYARTLRDWQVWHVVGGVVWTIGFLFEPLGDFQLARFKRIPENANRVMARGLWRYTRHPNYFGDFLVWWGLWLVAAAEPAARWTIISPVIMSIFLLRISGVRMLESALLERKDGYADYVKRTRAFSPWWPRA
jgi:steroid 5-alpha reductase family enzyme